MKIVVYEMENWERASLDKLKNEHQIEYVNAPLSRENSHLHGDSEVICPFIYSNLKADVLKNFSNLKLITTRSTGFDHIDMDYCRINGITVCNVPYYGDNTVAEHVFALLLTISHNITEAINRTRRGEFSMQGLRGFDLMGKTFGIVGTGRIGQHVAKIAKGFQMNVLAYDVFENKAAAAEIGFEYVGFEELLSRSDIITLHLPANEKTYNLISTPQFNLMKQGTILINTARGSLVDNQALLHALSEGKILAAGLDVLPEEPVIREEAELLRSLFLKTHNLETLLAGHILLRMRNVYITPHSAFDTVEAVQRILEVTMENILKFAEGKAQNVVTNRKSL